MCFLVLAIFFGLTGLNVFGYQQILVEESVATLSFEKVDEQTYDVVLAQNNGEEKRYSVSGDLWQVDVRLIKWKGFLASLGFTPGYQLDRLQGRYLTLEQERSAKRTVYSLSEPDIGFDLWSAIKLSATWLPVVDATYGNATFVPMADGAIFAVTMSNSGLVARPLNDRADLALKEWQ